jgi:antitoxin (DNA-binding transcriptional repressor) of toxin-antitoxin stability system
MQRAHAGERFLITRRGKPYVRLVPAFDQQHLAADPQPATAPSGSPAPSATRSSRASRNNGNITLTATRNDPAK